jgi:hypothetical protein
VFLLVTSVASAIIKGNQAKKAGKKGGSAILFYVIGAAISALLLGREIIGDDVAGWVDWAFGISFMVLSVVWFAIAIVRLKHYLQTAWWLNEWKKK